DNQNFIRIQDENQINLTNPKQQHFSINENKETLGKNKINNGNGLNLSHLSPVLSQNDVNHRERISTNVNLREPVSTNANSTETMEAVSSTNDSEDINKNDNSLEELEQICRDSMIQILDVNSEDKEKDKTVIIPSQNTKSNTCVDHPVLKDKTLLQNVSKKKMPNLRKIKKISAGERRKTSDLYCQDFSENQIMYEANTGLVNRDSNNSSFDNYPNSGTSMPNFDMWGSVVMTPSPSPVMQCTTPTPQPLTPNPQPIPQTSHTPTLNLQHVTQPVDQTLQILHTPTLNLHHVTQAVDQTLQTSHTPTLNLQHVTQLVDQTLQTSHTPTLNLQHVTQPVDQTLQTSHTPTLSLQHVTIPVDQTPQTIAPMQQPITQPVILNSQPITQIPESIALSSQIVDQIVTLKTQPTSQCVTHPMTLNSQPLYQNQQTIASTSQSDTQISPAKILQSSRQLSHKKKSRSNSKHCKLWKTSKKSIHESLN
ncbi:unnamed protein product, partial [Meganyctiphanes norvegica]